jgi:hypothetical protein
MKDSAPWSKYVRKVHPTICHEDSEGVYRYSSTPSLIWALNRSWSTPSLGRFTPEVETRYPIVQESGWSQDRSGRVRKNLTSTEIRSPDRKACSESLENIASTVSRTAEIWNIKQAFIHVTFTYLHVRRRRKSMGAADSWFLMLQNRHIHNCH